MEVLYERCAGIDVHKKMVKVCLIRPGGDQHPHKEIRTYATMTQDLLAMRDWLHAEGCTHVAMESTGVYWKPIHRLIEEDFVVLIVNAQHLKTVPGHKTDVKDAEWIADLWRHGLLHASYIPSPPQRELRELTRYRTRLVEERAREVNRLQKTLEDTNLKLGDVVSDVMGKAAQMILGAVAAGETDPTQLAAFAVGRVKASQADLERALTGNVTSHHRFMLQEHLHQIATLDAAIRRVSDEIARRFTPPEPAMPTSADEPQMDEPSCAPPQGAQATPLSSPLTWPTALACVSSIPGVSERATHTILAEIGVRMQQFPSASHLASWAGVCPGNNESAGKRLSGTTRHGNRWLCGVLVQAAHAAAHTKDTYLAAQYRRIASRRGSKRAAIAVAHSILVIIYHLLRDGTTYQDLGANYFDERERQSVEHRLVHRLERLGYQVTLQSPAIAG
jgi:transposase